MTDEHGAQVDEDTEQTTEDESVDAAGEERATGNLDEVDEEEVEQVRQERLDPENRPENVEVDNTDKEFDAQKGLFTDTPGYDEAEVRFPPASEQDT